MDWPLVADVPEDEVRELLAIARRRRFSKGEIVFHQHDPADSLHLISKGRFAIRVMTPVGDVATVAVRGLGSSFGEMALVADGAPRAATVSALEPAETFSVFRDDFQRLCRQRPSAMKVIVAFLAEEVRRQNELLLDALYVSADRRILRRLVELGEMYGGREDPVDVPLTQEDIAGLAGTSRATVNRVLREEEDRGTLALRRGVTTLLDRDELRHRAGVRSRS